MKGLSMVFLVTLIVFLMYKVFLVVITKLADKKYLNGQKKEAKFEFPISLGMHGTFICIWCMSMLSVSKEIQLNNVQSYIGLCLIGVFSVMWCYYSWDADHIFALPRKSSKKEKRVKKIFLYSVILIFVLNQGYHQTLHAIDVNYQVDSLFSVANYSIIVATIAFDRLLNQICGD